MKITKLSLIILSLINFSRTSNSLRLRRNLSPNYCLVNNLCKVKFNQNEVSNCLKKLGYYSADSAILEVKNKCDIFGKYPATLEIFLWELIKKEKDWLNCWKNHVNKNCKKIIEKNYEKSQEIKNSDGTIQLTIEIPHGEL